MVYSSQKLSWNWSKDDICLNDNILVLNRSWGGYGVIEQPCHNCEVAKVKKVFTENGRVQKVCIDLQTDPVRLTNNILICKVLI